MYGKTPYMGRQLGIQIKQVKKKRNEKDYSCHLHHLHDVCS